MSSEILDYENPMKEPQIDKVVVNIGVGEGGEELRKAERVLEMVTDQEPAHTHASTSNREWGIREGQPVGVKVTLRGDDAVEFLEEAFWVRNHEIPQWSFDDSGNLNFGIADYTDFEDHRYDPDIGIFGMDISVKIKRPGSRVEKRRLQPKDIPERHRVGRGEAMEFIAEEFDVEVW